MSVCEWRERGDELVLVIEADAFLRHMVRVVVGTMLLVGQGAWTPEQVGALLGGAPRGAAGPTAAAAPADARRGPLPVGGGLRELVPCRRRFQAAKYPAATSVASTDPPRS